MNKIKVYLTVLLLVFLSGCDFLFSDIDEDISYSIDIDIIGEGSVIVEPNKNSYNPGEYVTLEALPINDGIFSDWSGDANGYDDKISITINEDVQIAAKFLSITLLQNHVFRNYDSKVLSQDQPGYFSYLWDTVDNFDFRQNFKIEVSVEIDEILENDPYIPIIFNRLDGNNYSAVFIREDYVNVSERVNGNWESDNKYYKSLENKSFKYQRGSRYIFEFIKVGNVYILNMRTNSSDQITLFRDEFKSTFRNFSNGYGFGVSDMTVYYNHVKIYSVNSQSYKVSEPITVEEKNGNGKVENEKQP